ncbi:MAG: type II secretion system protein [Armatimonadetes bacterium]|nr:type II secretion system protein [Armatimonadota bacterium]
MRRAFTLIELLVVVAIIAILSAILFPIFAQAKAQAKQTVSVSNVRQIQTAWTMYMGDYDDTLMRVATQSDTKTFYFWGSWDGAVLRPEDGLLYPYTHNRGIEGDPSFDNRLRLSIGFTGYGYNYVYLSPSNYLPPDYTEVPIPVNFSQVSQPAATVGFASSARLNTYAYAKPTLEGNAYLEPPSSQYPTFHARTNGNGVVSWLDGHVKAFKPVYRTGTFGYGYNAADFDAVNLGEIAPSSALTDDYFLLDKPGG